MVKKYLNCADIEPWWDVTLPRTYVIVVTEYGAVDLKASTGNEQNYL